MSRRYLFPDNTVLCNFAAVRRLDLLETIFREGGHWTSAVAAEAAGSWWGDKLDSILGYAVSFGTLAVEQPTGPRSRSKLDAASVPLRHGKRVAPATALEL